MHASCINAPTESKRYNNLFHRADGEFDFSALWATLPGGACHTPFQSPCFLDSFVRTIAPRHGMRLHICEVRDTNTGSPVALFPYAVHKRGPVGIASVPDMGLADQAGPVLANGHSIPQEDFRSIWAAFIGELRGVDLVDIDKIPPCIGERDNPLHRLDTCKPSGEMLALDLTAGSDAKWRRKSVYKTVLSKEKRLSEVGVTFHQTQDPRESLDLFEALKRQRHRRFHSIGRMDSLESRPGFSDFYRSVASNASTGGSAMAFCLKTGDDIVAAYLAFADRTVMNGVLISIGDEKWHCCSPGMVLTAKVIDWSQKNGLTTFCFGTGMQDYKLRFGGSPAGMRRLSQPLTPIGRLFTVARQLKQGTF